MNLSRTVAERVAARMRRDGFACSADDVRTVWQTGTLLDNEALASRILQEFDEYGIEGGGTR